MRQTLHLLLFDISRQRALVVRSDGHCMLPIADLSERARAPSAVQEWLSTRGIRGEMVGQWMGRLAPGGHVIDWLAVVRLDGDYRDLGLTRLVWAPVFELLSSVSVLEYQRWALAAVLAAGPVPTAAGPFGHPRWVDEAAELVHCVTGHAADCLAAVPHRVSPSEVVVEYRTNDGRYFLKGLAGDRVREAAFTTRMRDVVPSAFARTATFVPRSDGSAWWLMDAYPGVPLASILPAGAERVAVAYADLQRHVSAIDSIRLALPPVDLAALTAWASEVLDDEQRGEDAQRSRAALDAACEALETGAPCSWIAADLDPANVLVSSDEIGFIDLDDALWGPAPVGMSIFARRIRRAAPECVDRARLAYERAWSLETSTEHLWAAADLMSAVLECRLGWNRLIAKTASGEVYGMVGPARQALGARLAKTCATSRATRV